MMAAKFPTQSRAFSLRKRHSRALVRAQGTKYSSQSGVHDGMDAAKSVEQIWRTSFTTFLPTDARTETKQHACKSKAQSTKTFIHDACRNRSEHGVL
jgi:hypothetical protein